MNLKSQIAIVVLVAAVVAAGVVAVIGGSETVNTDRAGSARLVPDEYPNGVVVGDAHTDLVKLALGPQVNRTSYRNTSGKDEYIKLEYADITATSTRGPAVASSSYQLLMGSSTVDWTASGATSSDFVRQDAGGDGSATTSLLRWPIATTTPKYATTTEFRVKQNTGFSYLRLAAGDYINLGLFQGQSGIPSGECPSIAAICESATSTNRGFNVSTIIRILRP